MHLQDYRRNADYLRPASAAAIALAERYTDYRPSVPTIQAKPVGWWEGAVVSLSLSLSLSLSGCTRVCACVVWICARVHLA